MQNMKELVVDAFSAFIQKNPGLKRVAVQVPDHLISESVAIFDALQAAFSDTFFFAVTDTSFNDCCVDHISAQHLDADGIIHFGPYCTTDYTIPVCFVGTTEAEVNAAALMKTISKNIQSYLASSPAEKVFLLIDQAPFPGEVNDPRLVTVAKETTSEGFAFYDFAFPFPVEEVKTPTCAVIYVGPHVKVAIDLGCLCYHQTPLLIDSCTGEPFCVNVMRDLAKRSAAVDAAKECSHVGIVVENPNIDLHIKLAQLLQNLCFANGVFANILYVGRINEAKVGNFPDLECFVHIACAGKELFSFAKPVLTPFEFICAKFPVDFWSNQELRDYGQLLSYCHKNLVSESDTPGSSQELDGQQDRQVVIKDFHQLTTTFESVRSRYSFYGLEIDQQNRDMQLHKGTTGNSVAYDHEPVE